MTKTLRSLSSAKFWRHCVLSGVAQRRALPRLQSEDILNISFPREGIEPKTCTRQIENLITLLLQSHFVPLRHDLRITELNFTKLISTIKIIQYYAKLKEDLVLINYSRRIPSVS